MPTKTEELKKIKDEILANKNLPLRDYRVKNGYFPVIGQGNHDAKIMFIGEAPGLNEAKTGVPFCGASGRVLDELLQSAGIVRSDVYITNILKDRPQNNRDPLPHEVELYFPYLEKQIEIIKPEVICTLGRYAMKYIMEKFELAGEVDSITNMHGKLFESGKVKIIPLYHPAVAVYNANMKETLKKDFEILKKFKDYLEIMPLA